MVKGYFILIVFNYYGVTQNLQQQQFVISTTTTIKEYTTTNTYALSLKIQRIFCLQ